MSRYSWASCGVANDHCSSTMRTPSTPSGVTWNTVGVFTSASYTKSQPTCTCRTLMNDSLRPRAVPDGLSARVSLVSGCTDQISCWAPPAARGLRAPRAGKLPPTRSYQRVTWMVRLPNSVPTTAGPADSGRAPLTRATLHGHDLCFADTGAGHDGPSVAAGSAILFVHGLMSSSRTWTAQLDRLAAGHRVVAPDLFGHGESAKPVGDYSLGAHAASLRDLLDALGIGSATVVGHSLGGGIALQLAYLFPERVDALVLVSSGGLGRELNPILRAATLPGSELVLPVIASGWVHGVGDTALRVWSRIGLPAISPSSDEAWRSLASLADGDTRRAFLATSRSVIDVGGQTVSAQNRLSGIGSRPVMLVWGERDRIVPAAHVEAARREIPHTRVEIFSRSGHFPYLDEPDRFAAVLDDFIAATAAAQPGTDVSADRPRRR